MLNTVRITLTSFLAYFILSAIISPLGVVSQGVAESFGISVADATGLFSWLTGGILLGSIFAIFIFDRMSIKQVVILCTFITMLGLLVIWQSAQASVFSMGLLAAGIGSGLGITTASVVITAAYEYRWHAPLLLVTDSSYSTAGWVSALLATVFLVQNAPWWTVYGLPTVALIVVLLLAVVSNYPSKQTQERESIRDVLCWPSVMCAVSLFFYLLGLVVLYSWLPQYGQVVKGLNASESGYLVSALFSAMFFGQLVMFVLVLFVSNRLLVVLAILFIALISLNLWQPLIDVSLFATVVALGFVGGGVLKVSIAYGANVLGRPSARLVSIFLFGTALGSAIAPKLSSVLVKQTDETSTMIFTTICYGVSFLAMLISVLAPVPKKNYG